MRQFGSIAINAFMELIRQPVFLLMCTASVAFVIFLASIPYFGFGDDPKLVKESVLAVTLLAGLLGAVLSAANTISREIHAGTALAVLSKPVGRAPFILAKFCGLLAALTFMTVLNLVGCLLASRMAYDAYGETDWVALGCFYGAIVMAYAMAAFSNYFLRRPFVSDAVMALGLMVAVAFLGINFVDSAGNWQAFGEGLDWRMVPAGLLVMLAVWVLAGLALACSTRLELISTLAVCSAFFLLGLVSDYFFGTRAEEGAWWASVLYTVLPNWQLFWLTDALSEGKSIPVAYLGAALGYALAYVGATVALALCLFADRELN